MISLRTFTVAVATAAFALAGFAQPAAKHAAHHPDTAASAAAGTMTMGDMDAAMPQMDGHMKRMQEMHEKMMQASTPQERSALMGEHMKMMQDGMAMMGGMGSAGMMGKGAMSAKQSKMPMAKRQAMMEKRMDMMQSMMQMMMDDAQQRDKMMGAVPAK